ncbi:BTAD domain-containing putative transcriptional regulator [Lentzea sp. NPDC051838]|uniref:AfsR/SARP family transcriptional regulator n=1 Tax=Lentzea sp. NPDC051838 TaxID=3154849 RepID=UPI00341544C0
MSLLLLNANRVVRTDALIDAIWGERLPRKPNEALHTYVYRLRPLLPRDVPITRRSNGYVLEVARESVDLHQFRALVADGRPEEALALWRGEPFAGVPGLEHERTALAAEHLAVLLDLNETRLRRGEHAPVEASARELAEEHPHDERVIRQLMRALEADGRQGDALRVYATLRRRLADELGVDPDPETRQLHQRLLAHLERPRELPAAPWSFSARGEELAELTAVLTNDGPRQVVISGPGGIGKTALALHWAHRDARFFPDGQLHVDLMGFTPSGEPVSPADALHRLLSGLGVPKIPDGVDARAALFRSTIAGRRLLLVLDNAISADQVAPLLPGTPSCAVVITSRNPLHSLITTNGVRIVPLAELAPPDARRLLADRIGAARVAAEPDAVTAIVTACGGLPLALAVAAGQAQARPQFPLSSLAEELRDTSTRLDALDLGSPAASLTAVLASSHRTLEPAHARAFGLLAAVPGEDLGTTCAAALLGTSTVETRSAFRALERVSLIEEHAPDRWRMHDLVRLYGQEHAAPPDLGEALRRLLDFVLHTAHAGDRVLYPGRMDIDLEPATAEPLTFPDRDAAMRWFDAEHHTAEALLKIADDATIWRLSWALYTYYFRTQSIFDNVLRVTRAAAEAAERLGDPAAILPSHLLHGQSLATAGAYDEAERHLVVAVRCAKETGDVWRETAGYRILGHLESERGNPREALAQLLLALNLVRTLNNKMFEADVLSTAAFYAAQCGELELAEEQGRAALALQSADTVDNGKAHTLHSLGFTLASAGRHEEAVTMYERAIEIFQAQDNSYNRATSLDRLGDTWHAAGRPDRARESWNQAQELYQATERAEAAAAVQAKLAHN